MSPTHDSHNKRKYSLFHSHLSFLQKTADFSKISILLSPAPPTTASPLIFTSSIKKMFFGLKGINFLDKFVQITPEGVFVYRDEGSASRGIGMQMGIKFEIVDRVYKVRLRSDKGQMGLNGAKYTFFVKLKVEGTDHGLIINNKRTSKLKHSEYFNSGIFKGMNGTIARNLEMGDSLYQELKGLPEI